MSWGWLILLALVWWVWRSTAYEKRYDAWYDSLSDEERTAVDYQNHMRPPSKWDHFLWGK